MGLTLLGLAATGWGVETIVAMKPQQLNYYDLLVSAYANAGDIKKAEEAAKKADALRK